MSRLNPAKFIREVRQETARVTWPKRREAVISTVMVLVMVVVAALFFLLVDWTIGSAVHWILGWKL